MQSHTKPDEVELRGFNRSLAEIEWLLLTLVLAYVVVPGTQVGNTPVVILACTLFALFVLGFRYLNLCRLEASWKLTLETWAMIVLTAFVVWHTGKVDSPLNHLYLLSIIFSALTLGKVVTLLQVALIAALYLHASYGALGTEVFAYRTFSHVMLTFAPYVLVAYLTALLAADMSHARASVQKLSETDDLTGLPNMRAFSTALERQCEEAEDEGKPFGVMMIDADELKPINDELGHEAGNDMILHVAASIRRGLRGSDLVARYGGDEFVVLLPDADEAATSEVAERVRRSVANSAVDIGGRSLAATVSIGYAVFPDMADEPRDLLSCADRALYESKHRGRDRAHAYREGARRAGEAVGAE
ncbi:MAG: GGDEF domain-containing protein [Halofilum sp. (in: g-proteobacteria)]|nr:GGDEF domain-containing protein [Halofilum sp. (in: g-proteobacteria)]